MKKREVDFVNGKFTLERFETGAFNRIVDQYTKPKSFVSTYQTYFICQTYVNRPILESVV